MPRSRHAIRIGGISRNGRTGNKFRKPHNELRAFSE
jgi:hypothetical protein